MLATVCSKLRVLNPTTNIIRRI